MKVVLAKTPNDVGVQYQGAWNVGKGGLSVETITTATNIAQIVNGEVVGVYDIVDFAFTVKQNKVIFDAGFATKGDDLAKINAALADENLNWNGPLKIVTID